MAKKIVPGAHLDLGPHTPIRLDKVSKVFGKKRALDEVTLQIPGGGTTCLIGPSGSGKSTLLRTINLLEIPTAGTVTIGEEEITSPDYPIEAIRQQIGMVFQHYSLFPHLTVVDNVAFALREVHGQSKDEAHANAVEQLERVGIGSLANHMPEVISGGERQRAAIARCLAIRPRIVLFDEITSALDPELVRGVLELVGEFHALGTTVVVVTHEMRFARESSHYVAFMDHGQLIEQGSPTDIFERPQSGRLQDFINAIA